MVFWRPETFPPVTMGHIRGHGCRDLLVYCGSGRCHHSATLSGDDFPDDLTVDLHPLWLYRRRRSAGLEPARQ
jgi:hypothetical protein